MMRLVIVLSWVIQYLRQARAGQVYGMSKVSSGASRPAQTHIEVHIEETTWVNVSLKPSGGRRS
jgi:hypothetical protein